jgi:hypothetical protein
MNDFKVCNFCSYGLILKVQLKSGNCTAGLTQQSAACIDHELVFPIDLASNKLDNCYDSITFVNLPLFTKVNFSTVLVIPVMTGIDPKEQLYKSIITLTNISRTSLP